jgi:hypothetical protein
MFKASKMILAVHSDAGMQMKNTHTVEQGGIFSFLMAANTTPIMG